MRRTFQGTSALLAAMLVAGSMLVLGGCAAKSEAPSGDATSTAPAAETPIPMKIGVLPTEDSLPLWVAEEKGYFAEAGIDSVEIVVFQSAQERDAAFASKAIDAFMGDIIAAANLEAGGAPGTILTVMLGADQAQGRFAVLGSPKDGAADLAAAAAQPVGTSSATIQEYVLDSLVAEAGLPAPKKEEVKKVPVRFELLMQGKLKSAALPEPFVSLAEQGGAKILADDTKAKANYTQTILFVRDAYLAEEGGTESADAVLAAWDKAAAEINKDPQSFIGTLVDKARLPEPLVNSYKVNKYPLQQLPAKEEVDRVLSWMKDKGYLKGDVDYETLTLVTPAK